MVVPESSAPPGAPAPAGGGRRTATQALSNLEFRSVHQFGPNYDRMGIDAMQMICGAYDNVAHVVQYVKLNCISMKDDNRAGKRAQYQELVDSAQTVDMLAQQYSDIGRSQEDLGNAGMTISLRLMRLILPSMMTR